MLGSLRMLEPHKVSIRVSDNNPNRKLAEANDELGNDVEASLNARGEERFAWLLCCIILFDCFAFSNMSNWTGPIVIGIMQLVLIIGLARKLRVEEIGKMLSRFMDRVSDMPDKKG